MPIRPATAAGGPGARLQGRLQVRERALALRERGAVALRGRRGAARGPRVGRRRAAARERVAQEAHVQQQLQHALLRQPAVQRGAQPQRVPGARRTQI